jgi:hypothetical protein
VVGLPFLHPHRVSTVRSVGAGMVLPQHFEDF